MRCLFFVVALVLGTITSPEIHASPFEGCFEAIRSLVFSDKFLDKIKKPGLRYDSFQSIGTRDRFSKKHLKALSESGFIHKNGLGRTLETLLGWKVGTPLTQIDWQGIFLEAAAIELYRSRHGKISKEYIDNLRAEGLDINPNNFSVIWEKTDLYHAGVSLKLISSGDEVDIQRTIEASLINYSKTVNKETDLLELITMLFRVEVPTEIIKETLVGAPYFSKHIRVSETFFQKVFERNSGVFDPYVSPFGGNSNLALKVALKESVAEQTIRSIHIGYAFLKAVERIGKMGPGEDRDVLISVLMESHYIRRLGFNDEDKEKIIRIISSEIQPASSTAMISRILMREFPIFEDKKSLFALSRYDKELNVVKIKDQCSWGSCSFHSSVSKFEYELSRLIGENTSLSVEYLYIELLKRKYRREFFEAKSGWDGSVANEGSFPGTVSDLIQRVGVIPDSVWRPERVFFSEDSKIRLKERMKEIFSIYKEQRHELFDNFGDDPSFKIHEGQLKDEFRDKIESVFRDIFGAPPKQFDYQDESYTPIKFARTFLPQVNDGYEVLQVTGSKYGDASSIKRVVSDHDYSEHSENNRLVHDPRIVRVDFDELKDRIIESIDNSRPIRLSVKWDRGTYKRDGKMFKIITDKGLMKVEGEIVQSRTEWSHSFHAVVVMGYELDVNGNISFLKIQNSWGTDRGEYGIYRMHWSYLKEFFQTMTINAKDGLALKSPHLKRYLFAS